MDVTGWTLAERARLPDWCFPTRQLIGCYGWNAGVGTYNWGISAIALPDPALIWVFGYVALVGALGEGDFRVGLNAVVPTTIAEMDAVQDFLPYYGYEMPGPNAVRIMAGSKQAVHFPIRLALVTGAKKLVIESRNWADVFRYQVYVLVSGMPDEIPAHLNPNNI